MEFSTHNIHRIETPNLEKRRTYDFYITYLPQEILPSTYPKFMKEKLPGKLGKKILLYFSK